MNAPGRVRAGRGETDHFALTDYRGRLEGKEVPGPRWAWVGQVHGGARDAAYRAMCALFLDANNAWVFDGYGPGDLNGAVHGGLVGDLLEGLFLLTGLPLKPPLATLQAT